MPTTVGRLSDPVANALLDLLWRATAFTIMPATVYLGLSTTQPGNDGSNITEPTDTNYALVGVTRNSTNFDVPSARTVTSAVDVLFPASTGGGSGYGSVGWLPVWSDTSRTTYLGYFTIGGGPQAYGAGVAPLFPAGSLTWTAAA